MRKCCWCSILLEVFFEHCLRTTIFLLDRRGPWGCYYVIYILLLAVASRTIAAILPVHRFILAPSWFNAEIKKRKRAACTKILTPDPRSPISPSRTHIRLENDLFAKPPHWQRYLQINQLVTRFPFAAASRAQTDITPGLSTFPEDEGVFLF